MTLFQNVVVFNFLHVTHVFIELITIDGKIISVIFGS